MVTNNCRRLKLRQLKKWGEAFLKMKGANLSQCSVVFAISVCVTLC
jgi:hypothetical protein